MVCPWNVFKEEGAPGQIHFVIIQVVSGQMTAISNIFRVHDPCNFRRRVSSFHDALNFYIILFSEGYAGWRSWGRGETPIIKF